MIKVYGVAPSPFVRKLLLALEYKNIDHELEVVFGGSEDPAFRKISPLGKIPVLVHDGFAIPDTSVICRYLERVFPEPRLYPEDPKQEAVACWLEEFGDTRLMEACTGLYMQRFVNPRLYKSPTDQDLVRRILDEQLPPLLDYLESVVPDAGYLAGESLSIADLTMATCFLTAGYGDFEVDAARYPRLHSYLARLLGENLVQARMESERQALAKLLT